MWTKTKEYNSQNSEGYSKEQEWVPKVEEIGERVISTVGSWIIFQLYLHTPLLKSPKPFLQWSYIFSCITKHNRSCCLVPTLSKIVKTVDFWHFYMHLFKSAHILLVLTILKKKKKKTVNSQCLIKVHYPL